MKQFAFVRSLLLLAAFPICAVLSSPAQVPDLGLGQMMGNASGSDMTILSKLLKDQPPFTAKMDVRIRDKDEKEKASMPMTITKSGDKMRFDLDITEVKNEAMPSGAAEMLKQFKMDKLVMLVRPDQSKSYIVFPGMQACLSKSLAKEAPEAADKKGKSDAEALGKETIDGHACVKNKVTATDDKGKQIEFTVWNATDLKNFPIQIATKEKGDTVTIRHKDVKFVQTEAKQFDLPADCAQYSDPQAMMQAVMQKLLAESAAGATPAAPDKAPEKTEK